MLKPSSLKALEKDPELRFHCIEEFALAFEQACENIRPTAHLSGNTFTRIDQGHIPTYVKTRSTGGPSPFTASTRLPTPQAQPTQLATPLSSGALPAVPQFAQNYGTTRGHAKSNKGYLAIIAVLVAIVIGVSTFAWYRPSGSSSTSQIPQSSSSQGRPPTSIPTSVPIPTTAPTPTPTPTFSLAESTWTGSETKYIDTSTHYPVIVRFDKVAGSTVPVTLTWPTFSNTIVACSGYLIENGDFGDATEQQKWSYVDGYKTNAQGIWIKFREDQVLSGDPAHYGVGGWFYAFVRSATVMKGVYFPAPSNTTVPTADIDFSR
jgi:hypothetical protein